MNMTHIARRRLTAAVIAGMLLAGLAGSSFAYASPAHSGEVAGDIFGVGTNNVEWGHGYAFWNAP